MHYWNDSVFNSGVDEIIASENNMAKDHGLRSMGLDLWFVFLDDQIIFFAKNIY